MQTEIWIHSLACRSLLWVLMQFLCLSVCHSLVQNTVHSFFCHWWFSLLLHIALATLSFLCILPFIQNRHEKQTGWLSENCHRHRPVHSAWNEYEPVSECDGKSCSMRPYDHNVGLLPMVSKAAMEMLLSITDQSFNCLTFSFGAYFTMCMN